MPIILKKKLHHLSYEFGKVLFRSLFITHVTQQITFASREAAKGAKEE